MPKTRRARACECDKCESMCSAWGLAVHISAVGDRSGDVFETYDEGNVHQACPWGRLWMVLQYELPYYAVIPAGPGAGAGVRVNTLRIYRRFYV